jgi:Fe-S oxidoreductase
MVDSPLIHKMNFNKELKKRKVLYADTNILQGLSEKEKARSVIIVQDAFTSFFETHAVMDIIECLQLMGFRIWVMPYSANGKPLHVHGFLHTFQWIAQRNQKKLNALAKTGIDLIGIDPSMTLTYRAEYAKYVTGNVANVHLIQEWLANQMDTVQRASDKFRPGTVRLLGHCTEKTNAAASMKNWTEVFTALNQELVQVDVGCCGMAGTYGHETRNRENSETIYDLSWRDVIATDQDGPIVTTGYSCRSQVKRLDQKQVKHPLQYLLAQAVAS